MRFFLAGLVLLAGLCGCAGTQVLNAFTPESGYDVASNLIYDQANNLRLDIYTPTGAKNAPVVVFFFGKRWSEGDKQSFRFVGQALASRGYVAVLPNYREYPEVRFPTFVQDGAAAVKWVHDNIAGYGGDASRMFLMGHSAGAHIAAMLALDEDFLKAVGGSRAWLKGMIGLAGPYDFLPITDPDLREIFGPPEEFQKSQPIFFVDGQNPPLLLVHGEDDVNILAKNTRNLAGAVAKSGGPVEQLIYPKMSHSWIIATLASPLRGQSDVLDNITDFIGRVLSGKKLAQDQDTGGVNATALPPDEPTAAPVAQPLPPPTPLFLPLPPDPLQAPQPDAAVPVPAEPPAVAEPPAADAPAQGFQFETPAEPPAPQPAQ